MIVPQVLVPEVVSLGSTLMPFGHASHVDAGAAVVIGASVVATAVVSGASVVAAAVVFGASVVAAAAVAAPPLGQHLLSNALIAAQVLESAVTPAAASDIPPQVLVPEVVSLGSTLIPSGHASHMVAGAAVVIGASVVAGAVVIGASVVAASVVAAPPLGQHRLSYALIAAQVPAFSDPGPAAAAAIPPQVLVPEVVVLGSTLMPLGQASQSSCA